MAKIVLSMGDAVLREIVLVQERITIGRSPHNDIVIDDRAISAEHAVIVTVDNDSFLEDLNSTNGTQVNGQPVKKHFLRDGDVVSVAGYHAFYIATAEKKESRPYRYASDTPSHSTDDANGIVLIRVLNGPSTGKEMRLTKVLTTLGHPPMQIAVIACSLGGYYLTNVEGTAGMSVNGEPLGRNPRSITNNDLIDLFGTQMRFLIQEKSPNKFSPHSIEMVDSTRQHDNNSRED